MKTPVQMTASRRALPVSATQPVPAMEMVSWKRERDQRDADAPRYRLRIMGSLGFCKASPGRPRRGSLSVGTES